MDHRVKRTQTGWQTQHVNQNIWCNCAVTFYWRQTLKNYTTDSATQEKCKHATPKAADAGNVTCGKMVICSYALQINKWNKMFKLQEETSTEWNFRHTHATCSWSVSVTLPSCSATAILMTQSIFLHIKNKTECTTPYKHS